MIKILIYEIGSYWVINKNKNICIKAIEWYSKTSS